MNETINFKAIEESDFIILNKWLRLPHVAKWWYPDILPWDEFASKYKKNLVSKSIFGFFILLDSHPIGFIQAYDAASLPDDQGKYDPPGTWGMDLYIADINYLGKGYGAKIINSLIEKLKSEHEIEKFIIDPHFDNLAAIRAYQKAGFKAVREGTQPYGKVLWMEKVLSN